MRESSWLERHIADHRSVIEDYERLLQKHSEAPPERIPCHQGPDGRSYRTMPRDDQVRRLSARELQQNERHDTLLRLHMPFDPALRRDTDPKTENETAGKLSHAAGDLHAQLNEWCSRVGALSSEPVRLREEKAFKLARLRYTPFPHLSNCNDVLILRVIGNRIDILELVRSELPHTHVAGTVPSQKPKISPAPSGSASRPTVAVTEDFAGRFRRARKIDHHTQSAAAARLKKSEKTVRKLETAGSRVDESTYSAGEDYIEEAQKKSDKWSSLRAESRHSE